MKLTKEEGKAIQFYKTKMVFKSLLSETNNAYTTILMTHIGGIGPAMHIHPLGQETFYIIEGSYVFTLDDKDIEAQKGDYIIVPANVPHKYISGPTGGQMLVTTPPNVENYFFHIADLQTKGEISREYEFEYAKQNGQTFVEESDHWGHK
jgi:quercetin dioxygenase-like cupin family protein